MGLEPEGVVDKLEPVLETWLPARYSEAVGIGLTARVSSFEMEEKKSFSPTRSDHSKYSGEWKVVHGPPSNLPR